MAKTSVGQGAPNILVIMGDDIGITNISAYSRGLMGYETPNIDRLAREGMMFTDYYGEQSCTAVVYLTDNGPHSASTWTGTTCCPGFSDRQSALRAPRSRASTTTASS